MPDDITYQLYKSMLLFSLTVSHFKTTQENLGKIRIMFSQGLTFGQKVLRVFDHRLAFGQEAL